MNVTNAQPTQAEAAQHYAARGFEVFPANPRTKAPLTTNGMKDATTDPAQVAEWWTRWPGALVACRIPRDQVVLDVDPRHGGDTTWNTLQKAYATILSARVHRSGRNDGGAHHWFKRPPGKLSARALHEWARRNGTGSQVGDSKWTSGIDILHHDHRYSILPPSPHPDTGLPYLWQSRDEPAEMPGFLVDLIIAEPDTTTPPPATPAAISGLFGGESIADWFTNRARWNDILEPHGWTVVTGDGNSDGSKWRHPRATAATSASIKHGCLFVYTPNTDLPETEQGDPRGITRFRAWAILNHHGDLSSAARAAGELRDGPRPNVPLSSLIAPNINPETGEIEEPDGRNLPEDFWTARPELEHIRQAAHSRVISADALLAAVLCRVAVLTPPTLTIPPIAGSRGSLNLFVGIVAGSGSGKTTAVEVAEELLPIDKRSDIITNSIGSGEGLIEQFFTMVTEEVDGKKTRIKRKTRTAAMVLLDEGQALAEMGARSGSTLLPTLRSAWSGSRLGQANASVETHRSVDAHTYRMALIAGFQPGYAHGLIADAHGGTPQRFLFAHGLDPRTGDGEWPGQLEFTPPPTILGGSHIDVHPEIADPIRQRRRMIQRGELTLDELDSHADLLRLKVSSLLAILAERDHVTVDDWELAGRMMRVSNAVRGWIIALHRADEAAKEASRTARRIREETAVTDSVEQRALISGAKSIARLVAKKGSAATRNEVTKAVAGKHRNLASVNDMLVYAVEKGWLAEVDGGWITGESRPS